MKKHHLDPNAKRDFSVLSEEDKIRIEIWIRRSFKEEYCPITVDHLNPCDKCQTIFPELKKKEGYHCPCIIFYVKDVIKIARRAVR